MSDDLSLLNIIIYDSKIQNKNLYLNKFFLKNKLVILKQ